jgi:hypothetical protein
VREPVRDVGSPLHLSVDYKKEDNSLYQKCAVKVNVTIVQSARVHHAVDMVCGILEDNPAPFSTFMERSEDGRRIIN